MASILNREVRWISGHPYIIPEVIFPSAGEEEGMDSVLVDEDGVQVQKEEIGEDEPGCPAPARGSPQERVDAEEDEENMLPEVKQDQGGWICEYPVPQSFFKFVIGKITVPRLGQPGNIFIAGNSRKNVESARRQIAATIRSARQRHDFTHFLSISMNSQEIRSKFGAFKEEVSSQFGTARGFHPSIFQATPRLHLTLGMLVLLSETERKEATAALQEMMEKEVGGRGMTLSLRGLEYMNDDPGEVDVLYAKVHCAEMETFRRSTDALVGGMRRSRYLTSQQDLKLHVTLMNTRYRSNPMGAELDEMDNVDRRGSKRRETFDARKILEKFGEYDFGGVELKSVDICQLYASSTKRPENEDYLVIGSAEW